MIGALIQDAGDPIVSVAQARQLAAAWAGTELWITNVGRPDDGPFGTHIHSYMRDPAAYMAQVTRFLDATFAP